VSGDNMVAEIL